MEQPERPVKGTIPDERKKRNTIGESDQPLRSKKQEAEERRRT